MNQYMIKAKEHKGNANEQGMQMKREPGKGVAPENFSGGGGVFDIIFTARIRRNLGGVVILRDFPDSRKKAAAPLYHP